MCASARGGRRDMPPLFGRRLRLRWWARQGSNLQPSASKADALSIELRALSPTLIGRVLHLDPRRAPAGPVAAGRPFRHDAFESQAAGVTEHRLAVRTLHVLREAQRRAGFLQRLLQHPAPADQLDAAQVLSLKPEQVEGVEAGARLAVATEQPVEAGQAIEAVRDRFAVKHDAGGGEGAHGVGNRDEVTRPVTAVARPQVHPLAVLMGEDAETVVLEFVEPALADRHLGGEDGLAREDEAGRPDELRPRPAGRAAHKHGRARSISTLAPESLRQVGAPAAPEPARRGLVPVNPPGIGTELSGGRAG